MDGRCAVITLSLSLFHGLCHSQSEWMTVSVEIWSAGIKGSGQNEVKIGSESDSYESFRAE